MPVPATGPFFRRLAGWQLRRSGLVVIALVAVTGLALTQLPRLTFDFRPEALLQWSDEERAFEAAFAERFGIRDDQLLIVVSGGEAGALLSSDGLTLLYRVAETAEASPLADEVLAVTRLPRRDAAGSVAAMLVGRLPPLIAGLPVAEEDAARVRAQVAGSRLIPGQLVSTDGSLAAVVVTLEPSFVDHSALDEPLAVLEAELDEVLATAGDGFTIHWSGLPFARLETVRALKREQRAFWPLTAALYLAMLWAIYRHPGLAVVALLAVGLATAWSVALLPPVGATVNVVNNIVPTLILVIGVANAIHMLHAYAAARRRGADGKKAARQMLDELGLPALLTSATTAIGFASLMVARNPTLKELGWQAAAGVLLSYVALITVLPVAVSRFTVRGLPIRGPAETADPGAEAGVGDRPIARRLARLVASLCRRPRRALAAALLVLAVALAFGSRVPIDSQVVDTFPPGHPIYEGNQLVETHLGGLLPLEIQVLAAEPGFFADAENLLRIHDFEADLRRLPGVRSITSLVDVVAEVEGAKDEDEVRSALTPAKVGGALATLGRFQPAVLGSYVDATRSELRLAARLEDGGVRALLATLERVDALADENLAPFAGKVTTRLTGEAYMAARGLDFFVRDLGWSLLAASAVIFVVLVLAFRSLRMGLLSLLPNGLPLALTLGLFPLYGYRLNTTTVIVFTIGIGMAVDNTIHLLSRFRAERRAGSPVAAAIERTYRTAGIAVLASNTVLIAGFAVLFASDFEPVFRVAVLTTTTIGAALLAAVLVLPPLLTLFGDPIGAATGNRQSAMSAPTVTNS